jgi:hypothetical protein
MKSEEAGSNSVPLYARRLDSFDGKTLEQKVREIVDREEIRDLIATYAHRMARGVSVADLFTEDGAYINRGTPGQAPREVRGWAALDKYYGGREDWPEHPLPMIHNHLIEVNGAEAKGICSVEIRLAANGESVVASGYYLDRFRRDAGRWKFVERDCAMFHWVALKDGWAKPKS